MLGCSDGGTATPTALTPAVEVRFLDSDGVEITGIGFGHDASANELSFGPYAVTVVAAADVR